MPCWQVLLSDSYDGRVDGRYLPSCFHQAIARIPVTVDVYTGTRDELLRALQRQLSGAGPVGPVAAHAAGGGLPAAFLALGAFAVFLLAASGLFAVRRRLQAHRRR